MGDPLGDPQGVLQVILGNPPGGPPQLRRGMARRHGVSGCAFLVLGYREAGITWFRMSRNYMVSEKWSSWEVVVFPSDHF